ncbi:MULTISPECIES: nitroreductase family protein [unclassified Oceanispirochaeta]|uniref:nitroreductase family protein n=1 Tax=unclassified Oceanispirochaeta TaxID=2635722 RepID=UPI000E094353|nr:MULTISPECIES: nitroreductase family protein [unclassified Oceanispirochaeta]MBF9014785.1 nitroreductase family protein [Oceanispirochaeta sp. M2]NPD71041.1 nitroreductase family protein [Oceanispirochaeta sp. M1]RDG33874.1 nitroreductase [Oceanispirochaeta sp. M1]
MDFFDVVARRFSYRKSLDSTPVPLEDLKKIVQAGLDAPSGKNEQTTRFIIIQDPHVVESIKVMTGANGSMATAPAYIAAHINKKPVATYSGHFFDFEDCAAAVENILLAATALGYSTVWIDGWLRVDGRAEEIGKLCSLDSERIIRILIPIGNAVMEQKRPLKKGFDERVSIV